MNSDLDEQKVLTLFPASKNFSKQEEESFTSSEDKILSSASGIPAPHHISTKNTIPRTSVRMSLNELVDVIDAQVDLLQEANKRMKFYMDEIEFFLPDTGNSALDL